jgi:hypothetical protein
MDLHKVVLQLRVIANDVRMDTAFTEKENENIKRVMILLHDISGLIWADDFETKYEASHETED